MGTLIHRRGLLVGLGAMIAAPAIVRASSIMPVRPIRPHALARPATPCDPALTWGELRDEMLRQLERSIRIEVRANDLDPGRTDLFLFYEEPPILRQFKTLASLSPPQCDAVERTTRLIAEARAQRLVQDLAAVNPAGDPA